MNYDVIVIGGGAIGTLSAYECAKENLKVLLLEPRHLASGASGASAAMLECQTYAHKGEKFLSLAEPSLALFPELHKELREHTGIDFEYENCGILKIAFSDEEATRFKRELDDLVSRKQKVSWLNQADLQKKFPACTKDAKGGVFFEQDGQVEGRKFTEAIGKAAVQEGVDIVSDFGFIQLEKSGPHHLSIRTSGENYSAKKIVLAAGAWSDQVLEPLNIKLGVKPIRGQLLVYETPTRISPSPIYTESFGYVTPKNQITLAGSTTEDVGFDETFTDRAKTHLANQGQKIIPQLKDLKIQKITAALRPGSQDEYPFLGPLPEFPDLIIATGHYRNGILLAPITGKIVRSLVTGGDSPCPIEPYNPMRFLTPA